MKKVLAFASIALIFAACNSVAKFKPQIEELAKTFDSTTSQVTEFATSVKTEQSNWANAATAMTVAPEAMAKWDDAAKAKYAEIQAAAQGSTTGIAGIASEVDGFVSSWTEKSNAMKALTDGLAAGKIEGDVAAQIADLTAAATDATSKLGGWKTKFDEVKATAAKAQQMFAEFTAASAAAPATAGKK
jgi:peptidoglycan hydrolase CwlO-like protein